MKIPFSKYSGNGNDFLIISDEHGSLLTSEKIISLCDRHFGIGADGILLTGKATGADATMRIFNSDGGEAEMCGNGIRCLATYLDSQSGAKNSYKIRAMNGTYEVFKKNGSLAVEMSEIKDQNSVNLSSFTEFQNSYYVNTGVPHLVFLGNDVKKIDVKKVAPPYRYHSLFPKGTNVSFVELLPEFQSTYVRTYERGVEDETYSCGTGLTATGLALSHWLGWKGEIQIFTKGGQQTVSIGEKVFYSGEVKFCFSGVAEL
jgi:diaminopimelate epimerase